MKKLLAILCFFALPVAAQVLTLRADVDPATVECGVFLNADQEVRVPAITVPVGPLAATGRVCDSSLAGKPNGNYAAQMTAISAPDVANRVGISAKSAVLNFVLPIPASGPAAPGVPQNPKLFVK